MTNTFKEGDIVQNVARCKTGIMNLKKGDIGVIEKIFSYDSNSFSAIINWQNPDVMNTMYSYETSWLVKVDISGTIEENKPIKKWYNPTPSKSIWELIEEQEKGKQNG